MGGDDKQQGVFCQGFFWVKFGGGRIGGRGVCSLRGPLLVLGRGCALVFGRGAEVLGRYVCSTRASSFLPFLIKFLEASLEFWFAFELVFPDLDSYPPLHRCIVFMCSWCCYLPLYSFPHQHPLYLLIHKR